MPGLLAIPAALAVFVTITTGRMEWKDAAKLMSLPAAWLLWVSAFRIDVSNGVLVYRSLFRGSRSLPLAAISRAQMAVTPAALFGPFFRLTIYPSAELHAKPIVINMKVFRREDLDRLVDILGPKFKGRRRYSVFERNGGN
jgi:hypothetical protein